MPYLGNSPASNFASVTKDTFSGDGSTTAFTLSKAATTNGVAVFVENVRQEPTTAYAVSGTTLTFTAAPVSASGNNIYVLHHNSPASTATHPSAQALTATSGTFTDDLTVDTDTLKVDASEDTVCINTTDTNFDAGADDLIVGSGSGDSGITIYTGGSAGDKGSIFFADSTVGSSAEKKGQISYEQNNEIMTFFTNDTLAMQIDLNGHVTKPLNSAFYCTGGAQSNLAIDGNVNFLEGDGSEVYDVNGDLTLSTGSSPDNFSPADVRFFTAPVTAKYMFTFRARLDSMLTSPAYIWVYMKTGNRTYTIAMFDPDFMDSTPNYYSVQGTVIADMDANDTAYPLIYISGGSATIDSASTEFSGILIG